jgi:glyoxylase-like metal-dependent hydrolase (beta-lactamase superfamily II)
MRSSASSDSESGSERDPAPGSDSDPSDSDVSAATGRDPGPGSDCATNSDSGLRLNSGLGSDSGPSSDSGSGSESDPGSASEVDAADGSSAPSEFELVFGEDLGFAVDPVTEARQLAGYDVLRLRANNPGPLTLSGTNTWIVDRNPTYVIDPGPDLEDHLEQVLAAVDARGGLGGIVLTHHHPDHVEAVTALRELRPAPLAAVRGRGVDVALYDGARFGPLRAVPTPGHTPEHMALVADRVCFTGDAVLGEGSVFIAPYPGALNGYVNGLIHLCTLDLDVLCPGHGPAVWEPLAKLEDYIGHRYDREHRLIMALAAGRRTIDELLDSAWADVPAELRPAAAITLAAHLDKLDEEGTLPADVEYPHWDPSTWEGASWEEPPREERFP